MVSVQFGPENFRNYSRMAYEWWYAVAEFVDNSTQSFVDHREVLEQAMRNEDGGSGFYVSITHDRGSGGVLSIEDNGYGMDLEDIERAMQVGVPPADTSGRSRYGLGMKTAAGWVGSLWSIKTTKLGSDVEYTVTVDVNEVANGNMELPTLERTVPADSHYTIIEVRSHNRNLTGSQTINKIKKYLASIYRIDLSEGWLSMSWNEDPILWEQYGDDVWFRAADGTQYKDDFQFEITNDRGQSKTVNGWVGILNTGSRKLAGVSILHNNRLIKGYPDPWKPYAIYREGSNDLINQRLVIEIHLDDFEVTHTKDNINWYGNEQEAVETGLEENCREYANRAQARRIRETTVGPSEPVIHAAAQTLESELTSPEMVDSLQLDQLPPPEDLARQNQQLIQSQVETGSPALLEVQIGEGSTLLNIHVQLRNESFYEPYCINDSANPEHLVVMINRQHPAFSSLRSENDVNVYFRQCIYDAVAEHRASSREIVDSDTIKLIKDQLLRVRYEVVRRS
jgi:hypothetical protein